MIPFWRDTPFSSEEDFLILAVEKAHRTSALRNNASTGAVRNAAAGSGSLECAIASALLSLGGRHAPIPKIYEFLNRPEGEFDKEVSRRLQHGEIIPGWGNSFFKGEQDPDWVQVHTHFEGWPEMLDRIEAATSSLHNRGKFLFPNAGCYTAATAIVLGLPQIISSYILISARLPVWTGIAQKSL